MSLFEVENHCDFLEPFLSEKGEGADHARVLFPIYKQLADAMRENERLKKKLLEYQQDEQKLMDLMVRNKHLDKHPDDHRMVMITTDQYGQIHQELVCTINCCPAHSPTKPSEDK